MNHIKKSALKGLNFGFNAQNGLRMNSILSRKVEMSNDNTQAERYGQCRD
jgi:hypothetical protein